MNGIDKERSKLIVEALKKRGATKPCPRCGHLNFGVVGETSIPILSDPSVLVVEDSVVPTAIVACNNCGFVTQHALGALDIPVEEHARAG